MHDTHDHRGFTCEEYETARTVALGDAKAIMNDDGVWPLGATNRNPETYEIRVQA